MDSVNRIIIILILIFNDVSSSKTNPMTTVWLRRHVFQGHLQVVNSLYPFVGKNIWPTLCFQKKRCGHLDRSSVRNHGDPSSCLASFYTYVCEHLQDCVVLNASAELPVQQRGTLLVNVAMGTDGQLVLLPTPLPPPHASA